MRGSDNPKNTLRLGFADTFDGAKEYFTSLLSKRFEIVRDDERPDYLIFGDRNFGESNLRYENCIRIFFTGENQRHTDYKCHYAISFDHPTDNRMFRLPLYLIYEFDHHIWQNKQARDENDRINKGFCSFVVKNPGCQYRNEYFHRLSQYKQVSSGGPLFNNMDGWRPESVADKVKFMSNYKFNLCFENSSYPGYCTEKLFEALCAKTIPIYWGSPTAALDFNPRAFLNRYDYASDDEFIAKIIELDTDREAYNQIYMQPMFRDDEFIRTFNPDNFLNWFEQNVYHGVING
jgi:alpha(1,3/1,4) fucosyltransferase